MNEPIVNISAVFVARYAENMEAHSNANPGLYVVPSNGWRELATRMAAGILAGRAHVSDMAKKTAKQLGFKATVAGVKEAINTAA